MNLTLWLIVIFILFYQQASLSVWTIATVLLLGVQTYFGYISATTSFIAWTVLIAFGGILNILPLRRWLITRHILPIYRRLMPGLSKTEKEALHAGTIGWEGELFSGDPNWSKLLATPTSKLTPEEQAFLDGPVEELCAMVNDWEISQHHGDLPPKIWDFLKKNGFFGLIIPKHYGGKEFSAMAHSAILIKTYACSTSLATTITVPNSLGPAELLLHYGTAEQKTYYLPRLARGEEIPCFALTGPEAGSDASAIPDTGIVCRGEFNGKEVIGIRLNWNKRYITLAPIATLLGLAFQLYDPEHLLSPQEERGITCALIPVNTPGIIIGRRHATLHLSFQNGPTQGHNVFIPVDWIIGGPERAGQGWKMVVQCLAVGRAISLPSSLVGAGKAAACATGAYARIRKQFNMPIGQFEGIQEVLARMAAHTYLINAACRMTVNAIDQGEKPAVTSAILKYHATEHGRQLVLDAMDVHGGKGICIGPRNYLARLYDAAPISITVEGANILTRNMIIFGQGAIRCHPYLLTEMEAANNLEKFDRVIFAHLGFISSNKIRAFLLGLTGGWLAQPTVPKSLKRYAQHLTRFSAALAFITDVAMIFLGGQLKRKERLSARLGDVLSMLYLASSVLKHYEDEGAPKEDFPLVEWTCQESLFIIQQRLDEIIKNFPYRWVAWSLRLCIFPLGRRFSLPDDRLSQQVAQILLSPSLTRDRLTQGLYLAATPNNAIGGLEKAFQQIVAVDTLDKHLQHALREKGIVIKDFEKRIEAGL